MDSYDLLVIGGGPGGYVCAIKYAQLNPGKKVCCVDRRERLGGTCLNVGCIPSKALLESSHYYHKALHKMAKHGVKLSGVELDMPTMMKQKEDSVKALGSGIDMLLKKNNITKVVGEASFISANTVQVGDKKITAGAIVIATGSEISMLPNIKVDGKVVITSDEALSLPTPPEKMVVIGGGAIGLELGSVWSRLGTKVTVIEYMEDILPALDKEISSRLRKYLIDQGIMFKLGTQVSGVTVTDDRAHVSIEHVASATKEILEVDNVIVCVGRRPHTTGLSLDKVGVKLDDRGRVTVDTKYNTSVKGIYAIGDVIAGPMLAHKAEEDGVALAEILSGKCGHVDYNQVPSIVYTSPEAASIGKNEEQLKSAKVEYKVGKFSFAANSRARTNLNDAGMVKVLVDAKTDEILGVHIIHDIAGELIVPAVIGMAYKASSEDLAIPCYPHPGYSEAFKEACLAAYFKAIHQ